MDRAPNPPGPQAHARPLPAAIPSGLLGGASTFARELVASAPWRSALAVLLLLLAGVTEAFGLMMIVPLLHVAGVADAPGPANSLLGTVADAAARLGVPATLPGVLGVFLALAAVRAAVGWWRSIVVVRLQLEFVDGIRATLYDAAASASWSHLLSLRRSDVQHVLTDEVRRIGTAAILTVQLTVGATLASVQLAVAMAVSPAVAAAAVLLGVPLALAARPLVRRSHDLGAQLTGSGRALRGLVTDFLDGLKPAKAHAAEGAYVRRIDRRAAHARARQIAFAKLNAATRGGMQLAAAAGICGLVWYGLAGAGLAVSELAVLAVVFARAAPAVLSLLQQAPQLANALPAYASAMNLLHALRTGAEEAEPGGATAPAPRHAIELRGLAFTYPGETVPALRGIGCRIPANSMLAVTGPSGAGKSTLADLLLGLLAPTQGEVLVDGVPLRPSDLVRWRRSAAYVPQEPFLLNDSVRRNLAWFHAGAAEADMWRALRLAEAATFVAALPHGLDTPVGDRGQRLSGGERQRVVLAGALLREPNLLVLDEPTSQLDGANEARLVATLSRLRGRMTVIAVAHGGPLLRAADRVLALRSGRAEAFGAWAEVEASAASS